MRQLSKLQSTLFLLGGVLMVVGAGLYVFLLIQKVASVMFLVGALLFATMQMAQRYEGTSFVIRRLRRVMFLADVCFVLASLLMIEQVYGFLTRQLMSHIQWLVYVVYASRNWVALLLVGALLEMYTTHRISHELGKEEAEGQKKSYRIGFSIK